MIVGNLPPINPSEFYRMTVKAQSLQGSEKGNIICTIGVVLTFLPSKQASPVGIWYGAPSSYLINHSSTVTPVG